MGALHGNGNRDAAVGYIMQGRVHPSSLGANAPRKILEKRLTSGKFSIYHVNVIPRANNIAYNI